MRPPSNLNATAGHLTRLGIWGLTLCLLLFAVVLLILPFVDSLPDNYPAWVALFFTFVAFVLAPLAGLSVMRQKLVSRAGQILILTSVFGVMAFITVLYFAWGASSEFYAGLTAEIYGALLTAGVLIYITSNFDNGTTTLDEETIDAIATKVAEKMKAAD